MVYQEDFAVERWMDRFETKVTYNAAESCCFSMSIDDVEQLTGTKCPLDKLKSHRLIYGNIPGSKELREEIATIYNETAAGAPIQLYRDDVLVTNGAIGANFLVYYALVGPGDHVIVVDPAYQQLQSVPKMFGADVEHLSLIPEQQYLPDLDKLRSMVQKGKTKLININNPHNPTGSVIPQKMMEQIVEIAREADAYLLCDEVYRPLFYNDGDSEVNTPMSPVNLYNKAISTGSVSKAFSLAGLRVGWVVSPSKIVLQECMKRRDYNTISVSMLDDIVATWALSHRRLILKRNHALVTTNLHILIKFEKASQGAVWFVHPQGGTTVLLHFKEVSDTEKFSVELAETHKVLVSPGEVFGVPGCVRIGLGNSTPELQASLAGIRELLEHRGAKFDETVTY
jgi:aspartate/methionine/tyrosine aminotransferase